MQTGPGKEFKETAYPDDSLEFPTRSHVPYNLNINQGCDILEQDIPYVVISHVYTKHVHKTRKYIRVWIHVSVFVTSEEKKKALIGDLAGRCQSHMYPSEDAKRTLAHTTSNNKNPYSTSEPTSIRTLIHTITTAKASH